MLWWGKVKKVRSAYTAPGARMRGVARHGEGRGLVHCWADPADAHRDTEGLTLLAEKPASLPKA